MAFTFEKLIVYQKAISYADCICAITEKFPRGYGFLSDQLNRACVSIAANMADKLNWGVAHAVAAENLCQSTAAAKRCGRRSRRSPKPDANVVETSALGVAPGPLLPPQCEGWVSPITRTARRTVCDSAEVWSHFAHDELRGDGGETRAAPPAHTAFDIRTEVGGRGAVILSAQPGSEESTLKLMAGILFHQRPGGRI